MKRQRLVTPVVLGIALSVVATLSETKTKFIHVTAQLAQLTFTGDPANPRRGDRNINNVVLFDESGTSVGTGMASCTIVSDPPLETLEECLLTAVFADGQIIFGGVAPLAEVGASAQFGI